MNSTTSPNQRRRSDERKSWLRFVSPVARGAVCVGLFCALEAAITSCGRSTTRATAHDAGSDLESNTSGSGGAGGASVDATSVTQGNLDGDAIPDTDAMPDGDVIASGGEPSVDAGVDATEPSDADLVDATPPDETGEHGPYAELTLSSYGVACGLKDDGDVECWGALPNGEVRVIEGPFTRISSVDNMACGIDPEGAVRCWFTAGTFQVEDLLPKLPGVFSEISVGGRVPCGIRPDKGVFCNGNLYSGTPAEGSFVQVAGSPAMTCGLSQIGELSCWTWGAGAAAPEPAMAPAGEFLQVATGMTHACAIATDHSIECWGEDSNEATVAPSGEYLQVSAGDGYTCAIRVDGSLHCWGLDDDGESSPPAGTFREVDAGVRSTCALTSRGFAVCWGHPI